MVGREPDLVSFDFPIHIADNSPEAQVLEAIVTREHVSPEEVIRRAIRGLAIPPATAEAKTRKRKAKTVPPLSDDELRQLDGFGKTFGLLADVPDEEIDLIAASIRGMKREGFQPRA
jgi:hypothetical protein